MFLFLNKWTSPGVVSRSKNTQHTTKHQYIGWNISIKLTLVIFGFYGFIISKIYLSNIYSILNIYLLEPHYFGEVHRSDLISLLVQSPTKSKVYIYPDGPMDPFVSIIDFSHKIITIVQILCHSYKDLRHRYT